MALSGSVNTSSYRSRYYKLSWTAEKDTAENKSTISWTLEALGAADKWYAERTLKVVIAGSTVFSKTDRVERYVGVVASGTKVITHDSDGEKSFSVSVQAAVFETTVNCTGSKTFTLDPIARKSTLTVANGTLGTSQTLKITEYESTFKHKLKYFCGTAEGYILGSSSGYSTSLSKSWTPPAELAAQNESGSSVSIKFTLYTYTSDGDKVGSNSYTKTFVIPSTGDFKPKCSVTVTDDTGYKTTYGKALKGLSKLKIEVDPDTSKSYSPIVSYRVTANGETYTKDTVITDVLKSSGDLTITARVTDDRGNTGTAEVTENVYNYTPPQVTKLTVHRCDRYGTENPQGGYIKVTYSGNIDSINKNTKKFTLYYQESGQIGEGVVLLSSGVFTVTDDTHIFEANTEASFDIKIVAEDDFQSVTTSTSASTAYTLLDFGADGTSIGVGKVAELSKVLDIGFETRFFGGIKPLTIPRDTNMDTLTKTGIYVSEYPANAVYYPDCNLPANAGAYFVVKVEKINNNHIHQTWVSFSGSRIDTYERYKSLNLGNAFGSWLGGDTGWVDMTIIKEGVTKEPIGLKSRIKDGVLYIKGAVKGISSASNDEVIATLPEAHRKTAYQVRFNGVYNGSYFCGLTLKNTGDLCIRATNGAGSWNSSNTIFINETICL